LLVTEEQNDKEDVNGEQYDAKVHCFHELSPIQLGHIEYLAKKNLKILETRLPPLL